MSNIYGVERGRSFTRQSVTGNHGVVFGDTISLAEAAATAYPNTLYKLPLEARYSDGENEFSLPVTRKVAIVRDDAKVIGVVGDSYELIQPSEVFDFFQPFLDTGLVELEDGGSLKGGSRMWLRAKVKNGVGEVVKGDAIQAHLIAYTSFDGTLAHGIGMNNERLVCFNQLASMFSNARHSENIIKNKHTSSLRKHIEEIRSDMTMLLGEFKEDILTYKRLTKIYMNDEEMKDYIVNVIEPKTLDSTKSQNRIEAVQGLLYSQAGLDSIPGIQGTAWQAYNAISEFVTHEYGRSMDARLNSQWFGATKKLNKRALELALKA